MEKAYADLVAAEKEVKRVLVDIDLVVKSAANREFGEKVALELYASLMDEAMKRSRAAFDKWVQEVRALLQENQALLKEEP